MSLSVGLHPVPDGHLAAVVTHLQMTTRKMVDTPALPDGFAMTHERLSIADYRALFRDIGRPWLWSSRLLMSEDALTAILTHLDVETWIVRKAENAIGLIELDFRVAGECELAFFGLVQDATGQRLGLPMIAFAQEQAFSRPIDRLHVHTCTLDAPYALGFYQKAGFTAYKRDIEIMPDPRILGALPGSAASHIPCLK